MLVREYGDPGGMPVIALHGTPASRLMYAAAEQAGNMGLRLLAPDRWGYGGTSPHSQPTLAAFADDIAKVADEFGIGRFSVLGVSGGGPYAAAIAACLAQRVDALALVAPVGPIAGAPVRLSTFHNLCFRVLPRTPGVLRGVFAGFRSGLTKAPDATMRVAFVRAPSPDRHALGQRHIRERFEAMFAEGLRNGVEGALTDMQIFSRPWDVEFDRITAPSRLWIGTIDNNVPIDAARRLACTIPGCDLVELPGEGHLWVAINYPVVLTWIASRQGR
jgi:pimeloyl-ACP methyl ester carboxylesterase